MKGKRVFVTNYCRSYGFFYHILQKYSMCNIWRKDQRSFAAIVVIFLCYLIIFYFTFNSLTVTFLGLKTINALLCKQDSSMDLQFNSKMDILQKQIQLHTQSLQSINSKMDQVDLFPITRQMLFQGHPICSFDPPNLIGSLEVNADVSSADGDVIVLQSTLNDTYNLVSQIYTKHIFHAPTKKNESVFISMDHSLPSLPLSLDEIPIGVNSPQNCYPHRRTAIVIPYRNRAKHLKIFLRHIHPFLQKQEIEYGIYVINMAGDELFNRGKLLNVGFREAMRHHEKYDCIIFHDIDLLPQNDKNLYTCNSHPKHMSVAINVFDYQVPYEEIFGGVTAMTPSHFLKVNGYSNLYWGWGGEDDDMYQRIKVKCMDVYRISEKYARYEMMFHTRDKGNEAIGERYNMIKGSLNRQPIDGVTNVKYKLIHRRYDFLYNNITVDIGKSGIARPNFIQAAQHFIIAGICLFLIYFLLLKSTSAKYKRVRPTSLL